ncbi:hypothetical protein VP150E351_P0142 [Vibrio phage 150E35-1]|nr:hypothetical protein VP150E351_P0142 [Vibrio phage 150E35-1]
MTAYLLIYISTILRLLFERSYTIVPQWCLMSTTYSSGEVTYTRSEPMLGSPCNADFWDLLYR